MESAEERHAAELARSVVPEVFRYSLFNLPPSFDEAGMAAYLEKLYSGGARPFVMLQDGLAVGVSCYLDIREAHRGLEIGSTWISPAYQGTFVNPASKFLLLTHAFEDLGCLRVQLKCDGRNERSKRAITKLGAKFEGVLRQHMTLPDGFQRDTWMYSIVAEEWPSVREGLIARLSPHVT